MRPSWSWSRGSWIYKYQCNQCLSLLMLWVRILFMLDTTLCDNICQWFTAGRWFSSGTSVSSTNKTDFHDITEILLKVALHTINLTPTYKRQEMLTLREHMGSSQFLVGFVPLIFLVFCVVFCFCFCILSLLLCLFYVFLFCLSSSYVSNAANVWIIHCWKSLRFSLKFIYKM